MLNQCIYSSQRPLRLSSTDNRTHVLIGLILVLRRLFLFSLLSIPSDVNGQNRFVKEREEKEELTRLLVVSKLMLVTGIRPPSVILIQF